MLSGRCDVARRTLKGAELATSGTDRTGRCDRRALLHGHVRVGDTTNVPELSKDLASSAVDSIGNSVPTCGVLLGVYARCVGPFSALWGDKRALRQDEPRTGALLII